MKTFISLLRGINVSGQKKIKMTDLKSLYEVLGFEDVATYIQSGNVIFKSMVEDKSTIRKLISDEIYRHYGFNVPVFITTPDVLQEIFLNNPFIPSRNEDIKSLHVTLLEMAPKPELIENLKSIQSGADEFFIQGKTIYLSCPNGYGRTKFTNTFFENKLKTEATTRNWNTLTKLIELTGA